MNYLQCLEPILIKMTEELIHSPLFEKIRNYLIQSNETQEKFLYVPYIKTKILSKLTDGIKNITIISTWHMNDLLRGSSELELYPFCQEHNYKLYVNNKIHLKVYSVALDTAIVATGNISEKGLEGKNEECGVMVKELSDSDRAFFKKIKDESTLIDDYEYQRHLKRCEELSPEIPDKIEYDDLITEKEREYFLKSELPMTRNVDDLINGYENIKQGLKASENEEVEACIHHDLQTYNIESNLSQEQFLKKLKKNFFEHPFVEKIDELLKPEAYWGTVRRWIRDHCKDVPLPKAWDLTGNTQTVYDWFVKLGEGKYNFDQPNYSQRLYKVENKQNSSSEFTNNLLKYENTVLQILESIGKTIPEIKKEYDKISNLYIHDIPTDLTEQKNTSKAIWHYKDETDYKISEMLSLSKEEIGERNSRGKLYRQIATIIGKLNEKGFLKMWYYKETDKHAFSDGVWRLTEKGKQEIKKRGISKIKESYEETDMKNPRLVLFSVSGDAAFEHYQNTILSNVHTNNFQNSDMKKFLNVRMWGANDRSTNNNRSKWSKLKKGDVLLFYRDKKYVAQMIISGTEDNYDIAKMVWGEKDDHNTMNVESKSGETWQLIMYAEPDNIKQIDVKMEDLNNLLGYKENFMPTRTLDFTSVSESRLQLLQNQHGSIQNALDTIDF